MQKYAILPQKTRFLRIYPKKRKNKQKSRFSRNRVYVMGLNMISFVKLTWASRGELTNFAANVHPISRDTNDAQTTYFILLFSPM